MLPCHSHYFLPTLHLVRDLVDLQLLLLGRVLGDLDLHSLLIHCFQPHTVFQDLLKLLVVILPSPSTWIPTHHHQSGGLQLVLIALLHQRYNKLSLYLKYFIAIRTQSPSSDREALEEAIIRSVIENSKRSSTCTMDNPDNIE